MMGIFDSIASGLEGAISGAIEHPGMMDQVSGLIDEAGGFPALVESFREKGLGETVASWIGNGENLAITPEALRSVLGQARVQAIADRLGLSPEEAAQKLSGLLPGVVDMLTPNGEMPHESLAQSLIEGFLRR